ncbi:MAG: lysophospholipid acyltransferase family protein [Fimbriimonadaceae bacterium]|nr:lysophospholipid acyltransferase family protein [Fimbriimonadaceae bacterium]
MGALAFRALQRWALRMTPNRAERWGERLGRLGFRLSRKYRERTLSNLELAFPDKTADERRTIAVRMFEHFGRGAIEFFRVSRRTTEDVMASVVEVEGLEYVDQARAEGKGALLIGGHFGDWELAAHYVAARGYPLTVVARDANQPEITEAMAELRRASGVELLARGGAARDILRKLKANELVGILPDQNDDEVFVPFFGKPVGTVMGPGVLHVRTGAPVIPLYMVRLGSGRYRLIFEPPLAPDADAPNPAEGIMRAINRSLEAVVRAHPEQYLWLHDRWKSARKRGFLE